MSKLQRSKIELSLNHYKISKFSLNLLIFISVLSKASVNLANLLILILKTTSIYLLIKYLVFVYKNYTIDEVSSSKSSIAKF